MNLEPIWGRLTRKTRGRKSHATVPLSSGNYVYKASKHPKWCDLKLLHDKCTHYNPYLYTKPTKFLICTRQLQQKTVKIEEQQIR